MKNKKKYILLGMIGLMILFGGILLKKSYAIFETNTISKSAVTIKVGTMNPILGLDLYVEAKEADTFAVTLENSENTSGKFLLYYKGTLPEGVTFGYLEEGINIPSKDGVVLAKGEKQTYLLYVNNQSSTDVYINIGAIGGLTTQTLSLPSGGNYIDKTTKSLYSNQFVSNVYQYDQTTGSSTFCVTGEESTCVQIPEPETYEPGTIIKYKVNDKEEKYFHVVSDNIDTLTLQHRENVVIATAWYKDANDNSKGPLTILPALETATSTWTNVLDQTYTMGTTIFKDNAYTGCTSTTSTISCTKNLYTLGQRTAKARMITGQELRSLGCTVNKNSCPIWIYNYLYNSTENGGTANQGEYGKDTGYRTMSASSSTAYEALTVENTGRVLGYGSVFSHFGARPVVVIPK